MWGIDKKKFFKHNFSKLNVCDFIKIFEKFEDQWAVLCAKLKVYKNKHSGIIVAKTNAHWLVTLKTGFQWNTVNA